jgi:HAD superfamily hydrolase (TIGR01549 family)
MDETLCDTTGANLKARDLFRDKIAESCGKSFDSSNFADTYLKGIYKKLTPEMKEVLLPITDEEKFRTDLLEYLFEQFSTQVNFSRDELHDFRKYFDQTRLEYFDFFYGVRDLLAELRREYTLVVITNGPVYSQHPKIRQIDLHSHVDHIIVGGEEQEEKPFKSIFDKACRLAKCRPEEAIHFGDSLTADIEGANKSCIKSVWISPNKDKSDLPDHTITNFIHSPVILNRYRSL